MKPENPVSVMDDEEKLPCAQKLSFDTKTLAEGAALTADWQYGANLKVYLCRDCKLWHLASG